MSLIRLGLPDRLQADLHSGHQTHVIGPESLFRWRSRPASSLATKARILDCWDRANCQESAALRAGQARGGHGGDRSGRSALSRPAALPRSRLLVAQLVDQIEETGPPSFRQGSSGRPWRSVAYRAASPAGRVWDWRTSVLIMARYVGALLMGRCTTVLERISRTSTPGAGVGIMEFDQAKERFLWQHGPPSRPDNARAWCAFKWSTARNHRT